MPMLKHVATGETVQVEALPKWVAGVWICGNQNFTDLNGDQYEPVASDPVALKVSPVEFKLLFTPSERVAIKSARKTDPIVEDIFDILEDDRLTHVNLGLPSTADSLAYLASKGLIEAARVPEILSGTPQ